MRIIKSYLCVFFVFVSTLGANAQAEREWSLEAGFGAGNMLENKYDDGRNYVNDNEVRNFYVSGDYYVTSRFALSSGLTFEQQGLFTQFSDGIGLKTVNMFGAHGGVKYYFFPHKWIFQPYVGAMLYTNVLNLGNSTGTCNMAIENGYYDEMVRVGKMTYDVSCPAFSVSPHIGMDVHLFSSVSLCFRYDYRFGLWGHTKSTLILMDGNKYGIDERNERNCFSLGLKVDFPVKPVSESARNNLLFILESIISSKAER